MINADIYVISVAIMQLYPEKGLKCMIFVAYISPNQ